MKNPISVLLLAAVVALALTAFKPAPAHAQDQPPATGVGLFDPTRFYLSVGPQLELYAPGLGSDALPAHRHEIAVGPFAAWKLGKHSSLCTSVVYGFENKGLRTAVGVRFHLYGKE